jgi:1-acyl-sn-glycerol-3-phosphate acyltransferase
VITFAPRAVLIVRLAAHFLRGLWIVTTRYRRMSIAGKNRELRRWSRQLLAILRVRVVRHGRPLKRPQRCLIVLNHVSWLDIFALYAVLPCLFVAKSEIRDWPLVGLLVERVGTLFIERGNRRHARRMNHRMVDALADGRLVAVCPEGTTTDGRSLKPFHAALLQPAIDADAAVLPLALRYLDGDGAQTTAAAYVDDISLMQSLWRITRESGLTVELRFAAPIDTQGAHRRDLAARARELIARQLERAGSALDTRDGPRAGSPIAHHPRRSPHPAPIDPAE